MLSVVILGLIAYGPGAAAPDSFAKPKGAPPAQGHVYYGELPLSFEANQGQTDARVKFFARGHGYTLFLTPTEAVLVLRQLVEGIRFIERMQANPLDKNAMAAEMAPLRGLFTKSMVARLDLPTGTLLQVAHLTLKRPGTGIQAARLPELIGRTLRRSVKAHQLLQEADLA